jgi:hypothetical protein
VGIVAGLARKIVMPETNLFTLSAHDVADIVKSFSGVPAVCLVALDCNWGPPVSGRFDTDFLQVWAAAKNSLKPKKVSLFGARDDSDWTIEVKLSWVSKVGEMGLFFAELHSPLEFPNEFVIQMETEDGVMFYDNNGGFGVNYRLPAYRGRMTSAVVGDGSKSGPGASNGAIWLLPKFTSYSLIARSDTH